jgi:hypothetical protein
MNNIAKLAVQVPVELLNVDSLMPKQLEKLVGIAPPQDDPVQLILYMLEAKAYLALHYAETLVRLSPKND